jgi:hypothetical protein
VREGTGSDRPGSPSPRERRAFSGAERQRVIDALCEHYAQDRLELGEFERRLDRANRVTAPSELAELLADLPALEAQPPAVRGGSPAANPGSGGRSGGETGGSLVVPAGTGRVDPARVPESQFEFAIWSGRSRSGGWIPAKTIRAIAFMGGVELDLREALFGTQEIRIHCMAVMGGIEILVPPGIHVDTGGFAVMGGFDEELSGAGEIPQDAPVVRVTGFALMGAVEIHCRLPGESAREARRRRRVEDQKRLDRARKDR